MQPISKDYSRLLTVLRTVQPLVHEYASTEPRALALKALERALEESIAQLETLLSLDNAITGIRRSASC